MMVDPIACVAMFQSKADLQRADWPLLQNGAVNLFQSRSVLAEVEASLAELGYEIAHIACGQGQSVYQTQLSSALKWKKQFGYEGWQGNLDALDDGVGGYPFGASRRAALIFEDFHELANADARSAHVLLDIVESRARDHLLWGRLFLALVQTDDPDYESGAIGARSAHWNRREQLRTSRGP